MKINNLNKPAVVWGIVLLLYTALITFFSIVYPYGLDEYKYHPYSLSHAVEIYFDSYFIANPRVGFIFAILNLWAGKWLFVILNPLVQLGIVFAIFYFVFLRKPDFKTTKDIYSFALICILSILAVPAPDNTLFWIGGACNYSWVMLISLFFLCLLRRLVEGMDNTGSRPLLLWGFLLLGIMLGNSNENTGTMALGLFVLTGIVCFARGIKLPKWIFWAFAGIILGQIWLFTAPGNYAKMQHISDIYPDLTLQTKLILHIKKFDHLVKLNLFLAPFAGLVLAMAIALDTKNALKNKDLQACAVCLWAFIALSWVLAAVSTGLTERAFYSAAVFGIMAFLLAVKFLTNRFGTNIFRFLFLAALAVFIALLPLIAVPYTALRKQEAERMKIIKSARGEICVPSLIVVSGPTKNLSITFYEPMRAKRFQEVAGLKYNVTQCLTHILVDMSPVCKVR